MLWFMTKPAAKTKTDRPRPAFIYLRVSTSRQASEGVSLDMQERMGRDHAARLGLEVVGVFREEGISGKEDVAGRPALQGLLEAHHAVKGAGAEPVVIVYSIKRLARRVLTFAKLVKEQGLDVSSITEPFDMSTPFGRAMANMLAVWAELDGDMISEQTTDALAFVKSKGTRLGGARVAMDTLPPEVIEEIHGLKKEGRSLREIAEALNLGNVPTATGRGTWNKDTVASALKVPPPAYASV